mmetsp:Transcript_20006/g.60585  ORF Transcript_20006/g.60585 Transcript_20006/m.60585 type:complete len:223 (+) Transcript_20006:169-837(+)
MLQLQMRGFLCAVQRRLAPAVLWRRPRPRAIELPARVGREAARALAHEPREARHLFGLRRHGLVEPAAVRARPRDAALVLDGPGEHRGELLAAHGALVHVGRRRDGRQRERLLYPRAHVAVVEPAGHEAAQQLADGPRRGLGAETREGWQRLLLAVLAGLLRQVLAGVGLLHLIGLLQRGERQAVSGPFARAKRGLKRLLLPEHVRKLCAQLNELLILVVAA